VLPAAGPAEIVAFAETLAALGEHDAARESIEQLMEFVEVIIEESSETGQSARRPGDPRRIRSGVTSPLLLPNIGWLSAGTPDCRTAPDETTRDRLRKILVRKSLTDSASDANV
jgi:hypothetical protein